MSGLKPSLPSDAFKAGDLLNNTYRIEGVLGRGYTSEVYLAQNALSGQVALKVLKSKFAGDDGFVNLTKRELEMRRLRHKTIVGYRDGFLTEAGDVCIVMDYIVGPTLAEYMADQVIETDDLITIADRLADGLAEAHDHGVVHRDLSPDNIILRDSDPTDVVIIDFGIAKDTKPDAMTVVGGEFAGKYQYAAPEQLDGSVDEKSDLYAMGTCLLAAYRRRVPDIGDSFASIRKTKSEPLDVSGVSEPLRSLIQRLTDPDPNERFQSANAVRQYIKELENREAPDAPEGRTNWRRAMFAATLFLCAVGGAAWVWTENPFGLGSPPMVEVYALSAAKTADGEVLARGHAPDPEGAQQLSQAVEKIGGTLDVQLASGAATDTWVQDVISMLSMIDPLDEWSLELSNRSVQVVGLAEDASTRQTVLASLAASTMADFFDFYVDISLPELSIADVKAEIANFNECGPIHLVNPPAQVFGAEDEITVGGKLADSLQAQRLMQRLNELSAGRKIVLQTDLLNPALCEMEKVLPRASACLAEVTFGYGDRPEPNLAATYIEGENPTIDVVLPAHLSDGHLFVFIIDVTGNAYSLVPNSSFPATDIEQLGEVRGSERFIRVAYSFAEQDQQPDLLAFAVDDTPGESRVYVVQTVMPVFDDLPPDAETVTNLAKEFRDNTDWTELGLRSLCGMSFRSQ